MRLCIFLACLNTNKASRKAFRDNWEQFKTLGKDSRLRRYVSSSTKLIHLVLSAVGMLLESGRSGSASRFSRSTVYTSLTRSDESEATSWIMKNCDGYWFWRKFWTWFELRRRCVVAVGNDILLCIGLSTSIPWPKDLIATIIKNVHIWLTRYHGDVNCTTWDNDSICMSPWWPCPWFPFLPKTSYCGLKRQRERARPDRALI